MSEATKMQKSMSDIVAEAQGRTQRKTGATTSTTSKSAVTSSAKFANIEGNTFYKIVFDGNASPEEKKKAVTQALTFSLEEGKEKNIERLKEFDTFKEYLQDQRKVMAQQILSLVDNGTFAELKGVIEDLNNGLIEFDERMKPLTDILDAVYNLRMAGADTFTGLFKEIKEDAAAEEERKKAIAEAEARLQGLNGEISSASSDIEVMKNSRSGQYRKFFGLGGLKESTIRAIYEKEQALAAANQSVADEAAKLAELNDPSKARQSEYQEFLNEKAKLRELLDISSAEHTDRQKALVAAVQNFINTSSEKTTSVQGQLEAMSGQIQDLGDANNGMRFIYTIVADASKDAMVNNDQLRTQIDEKTAASSSEIEKLSLEQQKGNVEEYLTNLNTSTVETVKTLGDLTTQGVRIKSMKDTNREQTGMIRELGSSGVAGMADRLAMAVNAVGAAATNESGQMAQMSLSQMNEKTNAIVGKEVIRAATNLEVVASNLDRASQELVDYRELSQAATSITRDNLAKIKDSLEKVKGQAKELDESLKASSSAQADVVADRDGSSQPATTTAPKKDGKAPSPFGKLGG